MQLDGIDCQILDALQREGRIKNKDVAKRIGMSASACLERIRRLERNGIIIGYRAIVDHAALGAPFEFWGEVSLSADTPDVIARFSDILQRAPEVMSAYRLAGRHDFLVHVMAASMGSWDALMLRAADEGIAVAASKTSVVVGCVKNNTPLAFAAPPLRLVSSAA